MPEDGTGVGLYGGGALIYAGWVLLYDAMILLATYFAQTKMCNEGHVPDHQGENDYPQFKSILY